MGTPRALLLNGTVGAGKTTVAAAIGELLAAEGVPHAVIDLDWLRRSFPPPPDDLFNHAMTVRNLRDVARNFLDAGSEQLVLAGVVETREQRRDYRDALGIDLAVCRLRVDLPLVRERLTRRHAHEPHALSWYLRRCGELDAILDAAGVDDTTVDLGDHPVMAVADTVRHAVDRRRAADAGLNPRRDRRQGR